MQSSSGFSDTWASVSLDGMRGAAALLVLLDHWRDLLFVNYHEVDAHRSLFFAVYTLTAGGHEAVMIFFVLSGFLIGGTVSRSMLECQWSWASYLTHRLARLWIVLVPGLLLCLVWDMVFYWGFDSSHGLNVSNAPIPPKFRASYTDTASSFFGTLFFLQDVIVPAFGSDGPLWSLANEFWYYILFPLGFLVALPSSLRRTRVFAAVGFALVCLGLRKSPILPLFPVWLMGVAILAVPRLPLNKWLRWLAVAAYIPVIFLCTYLKPSLHIGSDYLLGGATAALIWTLLSATRIADYTAPGPRICRGLARFSYTLYVVHVPFILLIADILVANGRWQPTWSHIAMGLCILAVTIGYAYIVAALTEFHTGSARAWVERRLGVTVRKSGIVPSRSL
jgi:peptidoglycan/LPS O-acetylase OafA/YrhL